MTTQHVKNYEVQELQFDEEYVLQGSDYQYCSECGANHPDSEQYLQGQSLSPLWLCAYCGSLNVEST